MEAPVQRLVLILPAQEQPEEIVRPLQEEAQRRSVVQGRGQGDRLRVQVQEDEPEEMQDLTDVRPRRSLRAARGRRV